MIPYVSKLTDVCPIEINCWGKTDAAVGKVDAATGDRRTTGVRYGLEPLVFDEKEWTQPQFFAKGVDAATVDAAT